MSTIQNIADHQFKRDIQDQLVKRFNCSCGYGFGDNGLVYVYLEGFDEPAVTTMQLLRSPGIEPVAGLTYHLCHKLGIELDH